MQIPKPCLSSKCGKAFNRSDLSAAGEIRFQGLGLKGCGPRDLVSCDETWRSAVELEKMLPLPQLTCVIMVPCPALFDFSLGRLPCHHIVDGLNGITILS